ncbi:MAG TPA: hypothetical protein VIV11_10780 [Kofleriaceae bacterium]
MNSTNVETAWAGAANDLERGLNTWTRGTIGRDRGIAVRAALMACSLVTDHYKAGPGLPPREYIDTILAGIRRWLDEPTKDNSDAVRSLLDVTRSAHAWQQDTDVESFWILEAVDHASLAVWAGDRASYIVPMDYATCAARAVACVLHAMFDAGVPEAKAVSSLVDAVHSAAV